MRNFFETNEGIFVAFAFLGALYSTCYVLGHYVLHEDMATILAAN